MRICLDILNISVSIAQELITSASSSAILTYANSLGFALGLFLFFGIDLSTKARVESRKTSEYAQITFLEITYQRNVQLT